MHKIKAKRIKIKGYGLVIDKDGMPCIREPLTVPDTVWNGMTDEQRQHANSKVSEELRRLN